jgi:hypothetical protein
MICRFGHRHPKQKDAGVEFGTVQFKTVAGKKLRLSAITLSALALGVAVLIGCSQRGGSGSSSGGSGSGGGPGVNVTGNWQITFTPTSSPAPISSMAGYLSEQGQGASQFLTAALQAQTSGCFAAATTVPMYGGTSGNNVNLTSFAVDGQTLSINTQTNAEGNQFSGVYSIAGGCAGGAKGTATGTEYAPLTGTFTGSIPGSSPTVTLSLSLSQETAGTGLGTFPTSGSAAFNGISCFSQGTLASENGSVIGDSVTMQFTTNDSQGATVQMKGTFDPAASTLTLSSIQINGGSCSGPLGPAMLLRHS